MYVFIVRWRWDALDAPERVRVVSAESAMAAAGALWTETAEQIDAEVVWMTVERLGLVTDVVRNEQC